MKKEKYDPNYMGGKCPLGYSWVDPHYNGSVYVKGYCRKIKKHRFFSEDW